MTLWGESPAATHRAPDYSVSERWSCTLSRVLGSTRSLVEYDIARERIRVNAPITTARIVSDLRALGVRPGSVLMVHASLSAISGPSSMVVGGAVALVDALEASVAPEGTLVMPAFSADYSDPASWARPAVPEAWWPIIRDAMPAWRADRARTFGIGQVAETFRACAGVQRSEHPQSSFCARGARAAEICAAHSLDDPLGPGGPLGRLHTLGASVLLLGCGFERCTALHLAEHLRDVPPERISSAAPIVSSDSAGAAKVWTRWSEPRYDTSDFIRIGEAFRRRGELSEGRVGRARALLFEMEAIVAFGVRSMNGEDRRV